MCATLPAPAARSVHDAYARTPGALAHTLPSLALATESRRARDTEAGQPTTQSLAFSGSCAQSCSITAARARSTPATCGGLGAQLALSRNVMAMAPRTGGA